MCGINGFTWPDEGLVRRMNQVTRHRGPDDTGVFVDERVSLGHNRLSIIDLSPRGHQPMANADGTLWITYNGEVYNYRELRDELRQAGWTFQSDSDTEVILNAFAQWGVGAFDRFNGMWAFAIYDKPRARIVLCRDRFGEKPLYYRFCEGGLAFSSMIGAVLKHGGPARPNNRAVMEFLAFNLQHHENYTFFEGIRQVPPGSYMEYDLNDGKHTLARWYQPKERPRADARAVREVFELSVKRRTVADVPVASCLSGGVDSSSIVALLDHTLDQTINTFSFIAPGSRLDESRYIQEVGKATNSRQFFTEMTEESFLDEVLDFVDANEEPVTSLSVYALYRVMKLAREHGAKVVLDGQGGDELFAGYHYYYGYYFAELLRRARLVRLIKENYLYLRNYRNTFAVAMFPFLLLPEGLKTRVWRGRLSPWLNHDYMAGVDCERTNPLWRAMPLDEALRLTVFHTSIPRQLVWNDKNAMRFSVEVRAPFLDHEVVETALSIPSEQKLKDGQGKRVFREAVNDILPRAVAERKDKIGFSAAEDEFLRRPNIAAWCSGILLSESFRERPYWRAEKVAVLWDDHLKGKRDLGGLVWKWLNTELWLREHFG